MAIASLFRVRGGVPHGAVEGGKGGLAERGLPLSFGDLEDGGRGTMEEEFGDGARSEFRLAEALWMDVLEISLSSGGHGH
jgi:hypothetical protein